jgi:hypothetical protein
MPAHGVAVKILGGIEIQIHHGFSGAGARTVAGSEINPEHPLSAPGHAM